jgi:hypothetical protein
MRRVGACSVVVAQAAKRDGVQGVDGAAVASAVEAVAAYPSGAGGDGCCVTGHCSTRITPATIGDYADPEGDHLAHLIDACWHLGRPTHTDTSSGRCACRTIRPLTGAYTDPSSATALTVPHMFRILSSRPWIYGFQARR